MDHAAHLLLVARGRIAVALDLASEIEATAGNPTQDAARVLRSRAIAPGRPRTFMIRPLVS